MSGRESAGGAATAQDVRAALKRTWVPFFARFGRLTPIQLAVIPKVLTGESVVVAAPTASGKTEAVVAPLAELLTAQQWTGLSVAYIVPTRALANDTEQRIKGPLRELGIEVQIKHGDTPHVSTAKRPNWLITTPESLDSLICRQTQLLGDLRCIVLDELHLIDATYRGDQVRALLARLKGVSREELRVYILSATLADPAELASRYADSFQLAVVPGQRQIERWFFSSEDAVYPFARQNGYRKLVWFCNSRRRVESVAQALEKQWRPYPVVAHHGSLAKNLREGAERLMREGRIAVCVATSTLEVGIDIGDIDLVVLDEPPPSVASLLQRIGRGNRRDAVTRVAAIAQSDDERDGLKAMFDAAATGQLPAPTYRPDLSVAVQQIFSLLFQTPGGLSVSVFEQTLSCLCSGGEVQLILRHLEQTGWVEQRATRWLAAEKLMDLALLRQL